MSPEVAQLYPQVLQSLRFSLPNPLLWAPES